MTYIKNPGNPYNYNGGFGKMDTLACMISKFSGFSGFTYPGGVRLKSYKEFIL